LKLTLERKLMNETCTIGELYVENVIECHTLELPVRDGLPGSAIPTGIFLVANRVSPRFGRNVPHIDGIPNRSNILIHWGNDEANTEGCILVGRTWTPANPCWIGESRLAFDALYEKIAAAFSAGDSVTIEILS